MMISLSLRICIVVLIYPLCLSLQAFAIRFYSLPAARALYYRYIYLSMYGYVYTNMPSVPLYISMRMHICIYIYNNTPFTPLYNYVGLHISVYINMPCVFRQAFAIRFYSLPAARALYYRYIRSLAARVNTLSGIPYADDPSIFSWELANEARPLGQVSIHSYIHTLLFTPFYSHPTSITPFFYQRLFTESDSHKCTHVACC